MFVAQICPPVYVIHESVTGVSWGSEAAASTTVAGVRTVTHLSAWEISLLTAPHQPRFHSTWVCPSAAARSRRSCSDVQGNSRLRELAQ